MLLITMQLSFLMSLRSRISYWTPETVYIFSVGSVRTKEFKQAFYRQIMKEIINILNIFYAVTYQVNQSINTRGLIWIHYFQKFN